MTARVTRRVDAGDEDVTKCSSSWRVYVVRRYRFKFAKVTRGLMIAYEANEPCSAADAAAYFLYTVASLAYNVLKITPLFILPFPSLSLSLSPSLCLTVPRDHRRLPPLSILRSLPAFKLLRPGSRRTRQNDREIFRNAQHPGGSSPDGALLAPLRLGLVIPGSGIKRRKR